MNNDVGAPGPLMHQRRQSSRGQIDIPFQCNGRLQAEQIGTGQGAERDLGFHRARVEAVPSFAIDASHQNVGRDGTNTERLTRELDAQRLAYEATAPVRTYQMARFHCFLAQDCCDTLLVLLEPGELAAELRLVTELGQPLPQRGFC